MKAKNLTQWSKLVLERDNHACQQCGTMDRRLVAHHQKEAKMYPKLRLEVDNGTTLCRKCHGQEPRQMVLFYDVAKLGKLYSRDGWAIPSSIRKRAKKLSLRPSRKSQAQ